MLRVENEIPLRIEPNENPFLNGIFAPVGREITADNLVVEGEIPRDLFGVYLRNGPNPVFNPLGRYHWFDGDGMIHALEFCDGKVTYRNRWIRTESFLAEQAAGRALWPGLLDRPDADAPKGAGSDGWLKDTANTDVLYHHGRALALFYQCGLPYALDPRTLRTHGVENFGGELRRGVSAHAKVDPVTNELLFFDYSTTEPFMTYNVVNPRGELIHHVPIELPGSRLPHDMAFTERYSILMDLPLFWDPELIRRGIHKVSYHPELPSRFAVLPRHGSSVDVVWFEASPCYIYHVVNAWEDGDEIVMDACRVVDPAPSSARGEGELTRMRAFLRLEAQLWRWRFNLKTRAVKEEQLEDLKTEWPTVNQHRKGRPTRYAYHSRVPHYEGFVKYDLELNSTETYLFGPGRTANELPFAPRIGATAEDHGYLVTFVAEANQPGASEAIVLDAQEIARGPIARIRIPQRVPVGFHSTWIPGDEVPR